MFSYALFLHVTDPHLAPGATSEQEDIKLSVDGIIATTRIEALRLTTEALRRRLLEEGRVLDGILFGGDAQDRGLPGGHHALKCLLLAGLEGVLAPHFRIVATPGNHDVQRGSPPGSMERYEPFVQTWRRSGEEAITPWLDGLDEVGNGPVDPDRHRFLAPDRRWSIHPVNTCNWSHTRAHMPDHLKAGLANLKRAVQSVDGRKGRRIEAIIDDAIDPALKDLLLYDIARVSPRQLEILRTSFAAAHEGQLPPVRIILLHHHMIAPSLREEFRPFADMQDLATLRTFLGQNRVDVIMHGHKHVEALSHDTLYDPTDPNDGVGRRVVVVSGGALEGSVDLSPMRLVELRGLPGAPAISVERLFLVRRGIAPVRLPNVTRRIWREEERVPGGPVVIHGTDIETLYARASEAARNEADGSMLVVHLDLPEGREPAGEPVELPFPRTYPWPDHQFVLGGHALDPLAWATDLADWWQRPTSELDTRIPYVHGARLRRFSGWFDQVERVVTLLQRSPSTSRGLAVLVDPLRDFHPDGHGETFASFCLVQFRCRSNGTRGPSIDCIAYYRAQEFTHWWPINVLELSLLQGDVAKRIGGRAGRITTITGDARSGNVKSPGQVAIPVVDRWLDQAPEKLVELARLLLADDGEDPLGVLSDWSRYLADVERATRPQAFDPEGLPVAVDGLRRLAAYVDLAKLGGPAVLRLSELLRTLAHENERYEGSIRNRDAFDAWRSRVAPTHRELTLVAPGSMGIRTASEGKTSSVLAEIAGGTRS